MKDALAQARLALQVDEVPVGAVVVREGAVVVAAHNLTRALGDMTAHAELLALKSASALLGTPYLSDCDLYVTLEPCPMCAQAISIARIRRLYFGAYDEKSGGVEHGPCIYNHRAAHHKPEIYGGLSEQEARTIMQDFFAARRKKY